MFFFHVQRSRVVFPFTLPSHFNRHLCMPPSWPLVTIHYSYFLVVRTNTLLLFPFEPCMLLPSKIEKQNRTKRRTPGRSEQKEGVLCQACYAAQHSTTSRAHTFPAPNGEKKGCWTKEASPFVFLLLVAS